MQELLAKYEKEGKGSSKRETSLIYSLQKLAPTIV